MSPLVRARKLPVRRATPSDSEIGTQMMKSPFRHSVALLPLTGTAMLHGTSNRLSLQKNQHTGPTTDDGF